MGDIQFPLLKDKGSKIYFHNKIIGKKGYKYKDKNLAGIIKGMLKQATGEKWQVEEAKCLANGDEYCEFACRKV
ncbi:MAG: 4-vinyl reductase [Methanobacteriota archaeon]